MAVVTFIDPAGTSHEVHVENGTSLMQAAMDNGISGIVAECGGACSCATCHVYVAAEWMDKAGTPGDVEKDMLECVLEPEATSRLSCQIIVNDDMDGMVVTVPQSQY